MKIMHENEIKKLVEDCKLGHSIYRHKDLGAIEFEITLSRDEDSFNIETVGQGLVLGTFDDMGNGMEVRIIRDQRNYNGDFSDDETVSILTNCFKELESDLVVLIEEFVDELGEYYRIAKSLLD